MQVAILGPLEVRDDRDTPIPITGARLRTLLVRLAVDADRPVPGSVLVDAVWGDQPPADEANSLQTLVSRLRRALGDPAAVVQSPAGYRLATAPDTVDAHRFEGIASDGARWLRDGDPLRAAQLLREALALWRGPALSDGSDALRAQGIRLADLRVAALVDRVTADLQLGEADIAIPELDALASEFPLDERIATALVTALASSGRQAEALRAYERVRERLADELGVDPSAELQAVHLAVLRGEIDERPPLRRTNLKAQLTSFVGREEEVARVGKALEENRLVTLVGPGGAGKTRLANEAGARLTMRDGVWLAELAPVTDGANVAQTVLGALGLREKNLLDRRPRPAQDAAGRLVDVLYDKAALLVLDNCEHLIDASARLAEELLEQCPDVRLLTTSREPLGIIGEVVFAVPPLGQPGADSSTAHALEYPAVRLFADRAGAARPDFAVDDTSIATVIEIVRRLDGLPLAIELAAARLRTMPVADIAARLSDRFRLLTGGSRTAMPRHRTLRAVVEWSWDLLNGGERRLVERLAVFPAGVLVESAAAVCTDDLVAADEVPDLLSSLIDKSLPQRAGGDGRRIRMLETIREYGIERLDEHGELLELRRRHADYFAGLLRSAEPYLTTADQLPWFDRLTGERENILAALRFRCDCGDADGALAVAVGYASFAMMLGNHADIGTWMTESLAVPGATDDDLRWIAAALLAMNAAATGTHADDVDDAMRQLKLIAANLGRISSADYPFVGVLRVAIAFFAGETELTQRVLEEELASSNEWARAATRMFRANLSENDGELDLMRADVHSALAEFRRLGERWGLANMLRSQALIHTMDGDLAAAEAAYDEALELMAALRSREDEAFLLVRLADIAMRRGELSRGRALMQRAYESAEETGSGAEAVLTLSMLAEFERHAGDLERAREMHAEAFRRIEAMPASHPVQGHGRAIVLALASRFAFADGNLATALRHGRDAYTAAVATRDMPITAVVGVVLAEIAAGSARPEGAAEMLGAAARLRGADDATSIDISRLTTDLLAALGADDFVRRYECGKAHDRDGALKLLDPAESLADL